MCGQEWGSAVRDKAARDEAAGRRLQEMRPWERQGFWHHPGIGWCQQREKIDWQELGKFDCQLVWMIFIFLLPLVIFHKTLASGLKIKF